MSKIAVVVAILVGLSGIGVHAGSKCCPSSVKSVKGTSTVIKICSKCGEVAGSKKCCDPKAVKCAKCELNKGSVGCCKKLVPKAGEKYVKLCVKCGEVKGGKKCCDPKAKICKCGFAKGSPACCKIKKQTTCPVVSEK